MAVRDTTYRCACCLLLQILGSIFEQFEDVEMWKWETCGYSVFTFQRFSKCGSWTEASPCNLEIPQNTPTTCTCTPLLNQKPQVWGVF